MFLKLSDLALLQMEAVACSGLLSCPVLGALREEDSCLASLGWRLTRLCDLEMGWRPEDEDRSWEPEILCSE